MDRLENDINGERLPNTVGFFFGESSPEDKKGDLEFIKVARAEILAGKVVYYTSWW